MHPPGFPYGPLRPVRRYSHAAPRNEPGHIPNSPARSMSNPNGTASTTMSGSASRSFTPSSTYSPTISLLQLPPQAHVRAVIHVLLLGDVARHARRLLPALHNPVRDDPGEAVAPCPAPIAGHQYPLAGFRNVQQRAQAHGARA